MNTTNMTCLIKNCLQKRAFFFNNEALEKARKNFHNCKKHSNKQYNDRNKINELFENKNIVPDNFSHNAKTEELE